MAIIICLTVAEKRLCTHNAHDPWLHTARKHCYWALTARVIFLEGSLKRFHRSSPSIYPLSSPRIPETAVRTSWRPQTHNPASYCSFISKLICLSREVKPIMVLDGTQLWHNVCAMYDQPLLIPECGKFEEMGKLKIRHSREMRLKCDHMKQILHALIRLWGWRL